jgi:hypothetical protein
MVQTRAVERDWTDARAKVTRAGACRVCGAEPGPGVEIQAAHTIGRDHDRPLIQGATTLHVHPDDVVPLCVQTDGGCHGAFDGRRLDLLPHLSLDEQLAAVRAAGGIAAALRRLTGRRGLPDTT